MINFIVAGVILSLLLKKNPLTILAVPLKVPFLLIGCLLTQVLLAFIASTRGLQYPVILSSTFVVMLIALFLNRHLYGVKWIFAGTLLNTTALVVHGGLMPVSETAMQIAGLTDLNFNDESRHLAMEQSYFWWLGDWIPVFTPIGTNFVWSPGDLFVALGVLQFLVRNSKKGKLE